MAEKARMTLFDKAILQIESEGLKFVTLTDDGFVFDAETKLKVAAMMVTFAETTISELRSPSKILKERLTPEMYEAVVKALLTPELAEGVLNLDRKDT